MSSTKAIGVLKYFFGLQVDSESDKQYLIPILRLYNLLKKGHTNSFFSCLIAYTTIRCYILHFE